MSTENRVEIFEDALEAVAGGNIGYTWDGQNGKIGKGKAFNYSFNNKSAVISKIAEVYDKNMDEDERDELILNTLLEAGLIW